MPEESYQINQIAFGIAVTVVVLLIAVIFIGVLVSLANRRKKLFEQEKKHLQFQYNEQLLQSQLEIQEQTLQQISRELHDNFGHIASLIKINLNTLKLENTEKAVAKIEDTKELTRQLITDIKSLSLSLNGDRIAKTGLVAALQMEVERLDKTGLFTASFVQNGSLPVIENDKATIIFRMAQEVLNNMAKYSEAKYINVNLNVTDNLFTLAFNDDGKGFNVADKIQNGGAGLTNLQKRAALINANLTIQSAPGEGTNITIEMAV